MGGNAIRSLVGIGTLGLSEAMYYSGVDQRKAMQRASDAQDRAAMEARRLQAEQKPLEQSATLATDTGSGQSLLGSMGLLVDPTTERKKPTGLNAPVSATGIGFGG